MYNSFLSKAWRTALICSGARIFAPLLIRSAMSTYILMPPNQGMKITHVLETHLHADFISGHIDLAEKTGANLRAQGRQLPI